MAVGERVEASDFADAPANFEIRSHFPQLAVLRQADAFVTHAGMNSTMESLYFGVPILAVPQVPEQEANARRAEELGLGRMLDPGEITAGNLREVVEMVVDDQHIRRNLTGMRQIIHDYGGAITAADVLERSGANS